MTIGAAERAEVSSHAAYRVTPSVSRNIAGFSR
jgi:hypothetical protein